MSEQPKEPAYEQVYIKSAGDKQQLFRMSDDQLVATSYFSLFDPTMSSYESNGKPVKLLFGYVNENGKFTNLCQGINCCFACLSKGDPKCRYVAKGGEKQGFYVKKSKKPVGND